MVMCAMAGTATGPDGARSHSACAHGRASLPARPLARRFRGQSVRRSAPGRLQLRAPPPPVVSTPGARPRALGPAGRAGPGADGLAPAAPRLLLVPRAARRCRLAALASRGSGRGGRARRRRAGRLGAALTERGRPGGAVSSWPAAPWPTRPPGRAA